MVKRSQIQSPKKKKAKLNYVMKENTKNIQTALSRHIYRKVRAVLD